MILYHYSNKNLKELKIKNFGNNYYTNNDKKISSLKRLFFYTDKKPEFLLSDSNFLYTAIINKKSLYNLTQDKQGLINNNSIDKTLRILKSKGFKGVIYTIGYKTIVNLFYNITPSKKINLVNY